ncbi:MAG TPA: hypothetical protein VKI65_18240 [Gemmataceae bacterium]|nr:hypothetical protein [Gemmataceae bacterium]
MPTDRIYLDKRNTVELLARLWQTERAVHGLSPVHWPNLLKYYNHERLESLREWIVRVKDLLGPGAILVKDAAYPPSLCPKRKKSWLKNVAYPFLDLYYAFCYPVLNRLKSGWTFPIGEIAFFLNRIDAFVGLLEESACPPFEVLVPLRMDLTGCRILLQGRTYGVKAASDAMDVEYFNKTPRLRTIPLSDIIKPPKKSAA